MAELLANGGVLPQLAELNKKRTIFNKKNGVGFAFIWLFLFIFFAIIWEILNADPLSEISVATGFFGFIAILVGSLIMLPSSRFTVFRHDAMATLPQPAALHGQGNIGTLPPPQQQPASTYAAPQGGWRTPDTGELVERGSVIENTTKLLKHDEK